MFRRILLAAVPAMAIVVAVGCDGEAGKKAADVGNKTADMAKKTQEGVKDAAAKGAETAKAGMEKGKEAVAAVGDAAKEGVLKPIEAAMGGIGEKIGKMSGDAATKAKEKFEALKKMVEEFKAAPKEKLAELGDKLKAAFDELKKLVGL